MKTAGVDHFGLGADRYPRTPSPEDVRGVHDDGNITRGLKHRGYGDDDVKKIMGGNFLRVGKRATDKGAMPKRILYQSPFLIHNRFRLQRRA